MSLRPRSLQGRLLVALLGAVVLVWLTATAFTWTDVRHELDELLDGHLTQAAALLVVQQARGVEDDDHHADAPQLHRYAPRVAFQVWHEGRLALRSSNAPDAPMAVLPATAGHPASSEPAAGAAADAAAETAAAAAAVAAAHTAAGRSERRRHDGRRDAPGAGDPSDDDQRRHDHDAARPSAALHRPASIGLGFHSVLIGGTEWRVFAAQGAERDVLVFVGEQTSSRADILWALLRGMLWPLALALPLLALAIWWAVRQGTAPLRQLGHTLSARDPQALEPVPLASAPAEMLPLLTALNRLFERITAMVAAERRFTADAAHELRTPIAAIRAQAQVALAEPDSAARAHALRATLAGCDRAIRLVEQMLTLSRLEAGAAPALAPLDLSALARRVAAELAPRAIARWQTLGLDAEQPHPVRGDETLVAVLLRNLIDNALRYSPDGAEVRVSVASDAGGVRLQVDDGGPGLAEAERERLGERFFRVLGSGQSGSGLGWSIVRRIAAAHGASVMVDRSAALGGLGVTVTWPSAAA